MTRFDTVLILDWSARSSPSPERPAKDAIWMGFAGEGGTGSAYYRTRAAAIAALVTRLEEEQSQGRRVLVGFDFPFGYPAGFAAKVTGRSSAVAVWGWLEREIIDGDDNANNRFEVAANLNARFPGLGPFWGRPAHIDAKSVPEKGTHRGGHGLPERRAVEIRVPRAQSVWKLYTTGSVGSQGLLGLPRINALRKRFGSSLSVWPFESADTPIVLAEVYPSLLDTIVSEVARSESEAIKDDVQVRVLAAALAKMSALETLENAMSQASGPALLEEGWILGVGAEQDLKDAARAAVVPDIQSPKLNNDCFALPPGVNWVPVEQALATLHNGLSPVVGTEQANLHMLSGRILATDIVAVRSNPPAANSAVDGYGFAYSSLKGGSTVLPLIQGRAAAGSPFREKVPGGSAIRILTGALLPEGVDTVILQEDVTATDTHVAFRSGIRAGANTRKAGEDVESGAIVLEAGHVLRPQDCALLAAVGQSVVSVFRSLRVGVLSTGDEVVEPGATALPEKTYDANRPMLLGLLESWNYRPIDLGHVIDDRRALRRALDNAAGRVDAILTSGGASAGDEDHLSALMNEMGAMTTWRIAVKPGRPLALGLWKGVPIFGLPGNPVAALVCSLIFARPALSVMAGGKWTRPQGYLVPAGFSKSKKPGRREYLRARLSSKGSAEVFASEGSGRISGLSWATGLVELEDEARDVRPGDPVRFIPYSSFGIAP